MNAYEKVVDVIEDLIHVKIHSDTSQAYRESKHRLMEALKELIKEKTS